MGEVICRENMKISTAPSRRNSAAREKSALFMRQMSSPSSMLGTSVTSQMEALQRVTSAMYSAPWKRIG